MCTLSITETKGIFTGMKIIKVVPVYYKLCHILETASSFKKKSYGARNMSSQMLSSVPKSQQLLQ